jgi:hypothetical protein
VELVSRIAALRAEARLPLATIQWYLQVCHGLELSIGAIVGALHRVAARGQGLAGRVLARVRASPVVHADETGWREAGANGYAWTFSTPTERYFVRGGRDKAVVDAVLGPTFAGVLVTDFYAAYDHYEGPHQRCWAHLLRDIHELVQRHPHDAVLREWATQVHGVYKRARRFRGSIEPEREAAQRRKISGGTQSPAGSSTLPTLATLFGTWRARGLDPLVACRQLLATSQL